VVAPGTLYLSIQIPLVVVVIVGVMDDLVMISTCLDMNPSVYSPKGVGIGGSVVGFRLLLDSMEICMPLYVQLIPGAFVGSLCG
jgi:hypothetical protein